jgi:ABC-type transporter Mla MlaB component
VGIFSFLKKKDSPKASTPEDKAALRAKRDEDAARLSASTEMDRQNSQMMQRDIARATALKIDAIESEMEFDIFNEPEPSWTSRPKRPPKPPSQAKRTEVSEGLAPGAADGFQNTLPMMELATTELLADGDSDRGGGGAAIEVADSAINPVIEEIAILYASEQITLVEQMLQSVIQEDQLEQATHTVWWMLFDLYQITGKQAEFDSLSIDYASKFETSPPSWVAALHRVTPIVPATKAGIAPTVAFSGMLDGSIVKQLEKIQKLSEKNQVFRLEFARVTDVAPEGCALLLRALKTLQKSEHDLIMVGAAELADKIQSIIKIGRRDETDAPWLLLLEMLQLLNREKDFEETSMDYCVTFEVSPPAFETPKNIKVTTAPEEKIHPDISPDRFMMPVVITSNTDQLVAAITEYAAQYHPVVIDCSRLTRIDFTAAGQLMNGLAPLAGSGKTIEFQGVNHLVAALLQVMGLNEIAKIFPHKY